MQNTTQAGALAIYAEAIMDRDKRIAELRDALVEVEACVGENLVWLADQFDLQIRQGNAEVIRRLAQIEHGWRTATSKLKKA